MALENKTNFAVLLQCQYSVMQEESGDILGIGRQTHSTIETQKRKMRWNIFISLLMFFAQNKKQCQ